MKILVNGKQAVLKKGSSFEYHSENPLFTEAEDYSFDIEFPMKDCPQNILIFGALHVKGVDISTVSFPCEIITESFDKTGILAITEVGDAVVKGQFLEGMSQQNFASGLPDVYLTELDFSDWDASNLGGDALDDYVFDHMRYEDGWAAMPVINKKTGEKTITDSNRRGYGYDNNIYCRCVYLYKLLDMVGRVCNYTVDMAALTAIPMFDKVVVANQRVMNMNQGGIRPLKLCLPRWKVKELFEEVGKFFGCIAVDDSVNRTVKFVSYNDLQDRSIVGSVSLEVNDDFEVEVVDSEGKYIGSKLYKLPNEVDEDHLDYCPGVDTALGVSKVNITLSQLLSKIDRARQGYTDGKLDQTKLYYISDKGVYAVITECEEKTIFLPDSPGSTGPGWFQQFRVINQNDVGKIPSGDDLRVLPCPLAPIVNNMFQTWTIPILEIPEDPVILEGWSTTADVREIIKNYDKEEDSLYYDKLWVVLIEGSIDTSEPGVIWDGYQPHVRKREVLSLLYQYSTDFYYYAASLHEFSYNLNPSDPSIRNQGKMLKVDETKLYRYKFLSKTLPDPKAIYIIKGKRYACLRLTAHFTVDGMSDLIEGEFYEIVG